MNKVERDAASRRLYTLSLLAGVLVDSTGAVGFMCFKEGKKQIMILGPILVVCSGYCMSACVVLLL